MVPTRQNQSQSGYYTWLLRNIFLPLGDIIFDQHMIQRLRYLEKVQWFSRDEIYLIRDEALRKTITVAYNEVPFYHNLMDQARLKPDDFQTAQDLVRFPVVTKQMLRDKCFGATTRKTGQKTYNAATSGSTGTNFVVLEDYKTAGWYRASFMLALEWSGWELGARHLQTGMTLKRSLDRQLKDKLMNCFYVSAYDLRDEQLNRSLEIIERNHIQYIWGYPGSLYYLAKRAGELGWNLPIKSLVTWGDILYAGYRSEIERVFKAPVFDTYGCAEGIQVSAQCGCDGNYHVHSVDVVVDCLDDDGVPVADGEEGHLVLTRLHPGPMPLIRYMVGDIGSLMPDSDCRCGRGFDLIGTVKGRSTDVVITPDGNRLIVHFFTGILEHFPEVESFQVVQNNLMSITLYIIPKHEPNSDLGQRIKKALQQKGADLDIHIEYVKNIPFQSTGKRRFIISEISQTFNTLA